MSTPPDRRPAATVVVVSWNTRELLRRCLAALEPDAAEGLAEVIVVDNASHDGSVEMVEAEFGWATTIRSGHNAGFGPAVNRAAELGSGEWLIAANADAAPEPGSIATLLEVGRGDPGVGAVAPRLITPTGETQHSVHSFPGLGLTLIFGLGLGRLMPRLGRRLCLQGYWDPAERRTVDWAHGAFLAIRVTAFEEVGGFEPTQWMYAEDIDLAWRLRNAGWTVEYEPAATVRHEVSAAATAAFGRTQLDRHVAATHRWLTRVRGHRYAAAFAALNFAAATLRWCVYAIAGGIRGGRWRGYRDLMREHARAQLATWRNSKASGRTGS